MPSRRIGTPLRDSLEIPLFPLKTVLFPGGVLPLRIFEQRYIAMAKGCLARDLPFGVCLITRGEEVALDRTAPPDFAGVGTQATIASWDMERARTEWLSALGFDLALVEREHGVVFVVHRVEIDFRGPAQLSDRLDVTLTLRELGRARLVADQAVLRDGQTLTDAACAQIDESDQRRALHRRDAGAALHLHG